MIEEMIFEVLMTVVSAFWIMVPAYVANAGAVPFGGGISVDFGKCSKNGRRYLGNGKTWRGLAGGIAVGVLFGLLQISLAETFDWDLPRHTLITVAALAAGALLGDLVKSFFKRRAGKDRGEKWPIADMYDLVAGSLALLAVFAWSWVFEYISVWIFIAILIWTPLLHRGANIIGYLIGIKQVPW
ncbi:MAG: CDP-2,3-bis-(O-geranylgeranyl)-sn-glycerol synthase [Methanocalculaceae archaeon]|jgi:CDP-2,3-bis-(O-geranylgeranyl)-sn-glycerol synthase|nr:CDP-2,3-bis-(O-geranylgeranyl)-sn-glycerol synthase [Methanocalculaceae archaeon]